MSTKKNTKPAPAPKSGENKTTSTSSKAAAKAISPVANAHFEDGSDDEVAQVLKSAPRRGGVQNTFRIQLHQKGLATKVGKGFKVTEEGLDFRKLRKTVTDINCRVKKAGDKEHFVARSHNGELWVIRDDKQTK